MQIIGLRDRSRRWAGVVAALAVAVAVGAPVAPAGAVIANDDPRPPFYDTPASLPAANGDLVRSEPATFKILGPVESRARATRIMYRSSNHRDEAIAVTGTLLVPNKAWSGKGARPLIGYGVGTQGMHDSCAPSRMMSSGTEYEGLFLAGLLNRGWAVVVTDYEGLGTDGDHTYMSREVQGRAVLDAVRAAQRFGDPQVPADGPVGLAGYSQGGGAVAAAAELAPGYAPELDIKGVAAGAVPADLGEVAAKIDGSLWFGFLGFAIAGLAESYDLDLDPYLNEEGRKVFGQVVEACVGDAIFQLGLKRSSRLTADGRPVTELIENEPFRTILEEQLIGNGRKPTAPTLLSHSLLDDTIPYSAGKALAKRWCGQGAPVKFSTNATPLHLLAMVRIYPEAVSFLADRFAGRAMSSNCRWI